MSAQDSGGYNNDEIEVKLQKAVQGMTKHIGENLKLTKNQVVQLRKTIMQHEKKYKSDKDHWAWKDKDRLKQRKVSLEKIEFQGKQVRLNKQLTAVMKQNIQSYEYVKQSLTGGGRSLRSAVGGVADSLFYLTKNTKDLRKAQEDLKKAKAAGQGHSGEQDKVDALEKLVSRYGGNSRIMQLIASKLEGLGKIMEKHQGKIIIGAGIASVLIGIITKALSVAPLFQAMMKLMQFAVTMILMPIGTFFGAILRPIVIGLVKGIAPQFKDWMKTAMSLGTKIGEFMVEFFNDPAKALSGLVTNALGGDPAAISGTIATTAGIGVATVVAAKILPKVLGIGVSAASKTGGVITFATGADDVGKATSKLIPKLAPKLMATISKIFAPKFAETLSKSLLPKLAAKLSLKAISRVLGPIGLALGGLDVAGSAIKHFAPDQYEGIREGAKGIGSFFGDTEGTHTEGLLDFLGFGSQSTFEQLGEGFQELSDMFKGDSSQTMAEAAEKSAHYIEILEAAAVKIGTKNAPVMDQQMNEIMNHFIRMKEMGMTSTRAAENIATNFVHADATITAKLASWVAAARVMTAGEGKSKKPLIEALNAQNQYGYAQGIGDTDNFFGSGTSFFTKSNQGTKSLQTKMEEQAALAIIEFDKVGNRMKYDQIYPSGERKEDPLSQKNKYKERLAEIEATQGKTRAQMEKEINPSNIPLLSTGGLDWVARLASTDTNYGGGQINEPIMGIGRSGRTYSFGEHGAETITPNGGGGGGITINIAKIEKNADFEQLKPMIQRWILEANSRRGMI